MFIRKIWSKIVKIKQLSATQQERPTDGSPCKMFCQRCGKSVGPTAAYSRHCGAPVVSADDADVVITAATTAPSDVPCETRSPVTSAPSTASSAEGAALRLEIGWLGAALSDAAAEHASASEASSAEGAALRSEIGRLEAVLSEAAASMYPATQWQ